MGLKMREYNGENIKDFDEHMDAFYAAWPELLADISEDPYFLQFPKASVDWMMFVLKNMPKGKHGRAAAAIKFFIHLNPSPTKEELRLVYFGGWCAEILQSAGLMCDDIMDGSETRRGEVCWYRRKDVGLGTAVNDVFMLENLVYYLQWKYHDDKEVYLKGLRLSQDIALKTIFGQGLDSRIKDASHYTMENFTEIAKYKTSYYTFYAPLAGALARAGIKEQKIYVSLEEFALKLGHLYQVQDDILDCYGNPEITGKIGTDILTGKVTWLVVTALELADDAQRETLLSCIGTKDKNDEIKVKAIYDELEIADRFRRYEDDTYKELSASIENAYEVIPKKPLFDMLDAIYQRDH